MIQNAIGKKESGDIAIGEISCKIVTINDVDVPGAG